MAMGALYHLSNPSAARLAAVHDSTKRVIAIRMCCAVLFAGWLGIVGWAVAKPVDAIAGALSAAASNIKISIQ